jgi:hypothetical protein
MPRLAPVTTTMGALVIPCFLLIAVMRLSWLTFVGQNVVTGARVRRPIDCEPVEPDDFFPSQIVG